MVTRLHELAESCRQEIEMHCRPVGRVSNAVPLTWYDESHPYIVAMYDTGGNPRPRDEQFAQPVAKFNRPIIGSTTPRKETP